RVVTEITGTVLDLHVGPDGRVHMMVALPTGWEAWSAPVAGGAAMRELPTPWTALWPAPRGGWGAALRIGRGPAIRARLVPPGSDVNGPGAREVAVDSGDAWTPAAAWTPDGQSWLYLRAGVVHRLKVESGEDAIIPTAVSEVGDFAVSLDGENLYMTQG